MRPNRRSGISEDTSGLLGVAVEFERRRGRGTTSNASGRYEPTARIAFDDGWRSLDELPAFKTEGNDRRDPQDHHPQPVAGHRLRPLDQSLSRLRARLRVLLCAADPRLSRPVAGPRLRIQAICEARGGGAPGEGALSNPKYTPAVLGDRHQHRSVSADRAPLQSDAANPRSAGQDQSSGRHRDEVGAGAARPRHSGPHGRARSGQGCAVGHDA